MIHRRDTHSISDFKRNTGAHLRRLRRTGKPEMLTTHGAAAVVVQDAAAYEKQMLELEQRRLEAMLLEGLAGEGQKMSADELRERLRIRVIGGDAR